MRGISKKNNNQVIVIILLILNLAVGVFAITNNSSEKTLVAMNIPKTVAKKMIKEYVCKKTIEGILNHELSNKFATQDTVDSVKELDYKVLNIESYKIVSSKLIEEYKCRVFLKKGNDLKSATVILTSDINADFLYKVHTIDTSREGQL